MRTLSSLALTAVLAFPLTAFATPAAPAKPTTAATHKVAPKAPATTKTTHHMKKDQKKIETPTTPAPSVTTPAK